LLSGYTKNLPQIPLLCPRYRRLLFSANVKNPLKAAYFEIKIYHEVEKAGEGRERKALYRNLFDLFDLADKNSSETW
jgi:hypothetical protein